MIDEDNTIYCRTNKTISPFYCYTKTIKKMLKQKNSLSPHFFIDKIKKCSNQNVRNGH